MSSSHVQDYTTIITWEPLIKLRDRVEEQWYNKHKPVAISGGARCGKTTLLIDLINRTSSIKPTAAAIFMIYPVAKASIQSLFLSYDIHLKFEAVNNVEKYLLNPLPVTIIESPFDNNLSLNLFKTLSKSHTSLIAIGQRGHQLSAWKREIDVWCYDTWDLNPDFIEELQHDKDDKLADYFKGSY